MQPRQQRPTTHVRFTASTTPATADESDPLVEALQTISRRLVALTTSALLQLKEAHGRDVTLPEYRILVLVSRGEVITPSGLAAELDVTRPAVTQILRLLTEKRLIHRRSSGQDGRRVELSITPRGRAIVDAVIDERARCLSPALNGFSARERRSLLASLEKLEQALTAAKPSSLSRAVE